MAQQPGITASVHLPGALVPAAGSPTDGQQHLQPAIMSTASPPHAPRSLPVPTCRSTNPGPRQFDVEALTARGFVDAPDDAPRIADHPATVDPVRTPRHGSPAPPARTRPARAADAAASTSAEPLHRFRVDPVRRRHRIRPGRRRWVETHKTQRSRRPARLPARPHVAAPPNRKPDNRTPVRTADPAGRNGRKIPAAPQPGQPDRRSSHLLAAAAGRRQLPPRSISAWFRNGWSSPRRAAAASTGWTPPRTSAGWPPRERPTQLRRPNRGRTAHPQARRAARPRRSGPAEDADARDPEEIRSNLTRHLSGVRSGRAKAQYNDGGLA